ncbi:MAG: protein-export membrane protein SecF [Spirochaetes bacterium GWF1_51_8]|nr:MAG: protein-export membrane protein SecF [Spirochaetes bacterium GWF1_51_8]
MENQNTTPQEKTQKVWGLKVHKRVHFIGMRKFSFLFSALILLAGIALYFVKGGFKMGIDFQGGTRVEVNINAANVNIDSIRQLFMKDNFDSSVNTVGDPTKQHYLITVSDLTEKTVIAPTNITMILEQKFGSNTIELLGSEEIGPKVAENTGQRLITLLLFVSLLILLFVALRFNFLYGAGAVLALFHDIAIMAAFALFLDIPIDSTIIAAFLTILGYSINDTIVVFDRVRESHKLNPEEDYEMVMDRSITVTLSRTLVTSLTTLFVAISITIWGGRVLSNFGLMLCIGIVSGTYSSIFVASPISFMLRNAMHKKKPSEKKAK